MKSCIHITVSGPGECINVEMQIIQHALEALGHNVVVINEYPPKEPIDIKPVTEEYKKYWYIKLEADHQPWGG